MPARKKTRRRKNPVRPGELFVIVDVSSPGGTWDGQIYRGLAKADQEAAKRKGQRVQVIDAMWYTPARNVLETSGLIARTRKNPSAEDRYLVQEYMAEQAADAYDPWDEPGFYRTREEANRDIRRLIRGTKTRTLSTILNRLKRTKGMSPDQYRRASDELRYLRQVYGENIEGMQAIKMIEKELASRRAKGTRKNPRVNTKKGYMKVNASIDRMGALHLEPVSQKACTAYSKHMEEMTGHYDCTAYIQNDWDVDSFIAEYVPPSKRRDLHGGWDATFLMDPWIFGHVLGYDAHNVSW